MDLYNYYWIWIFIGFMYLLLDYWILDYIPSHLLRLKVANQTKVPRAKKPPI